MHPMLNIAIRAARKAGNHITKSFSNFGKLKLTQKGPNDFVTNIDKEAEIIIIDIIQNAYPTHSILSEEVGFIKGNHSNVQWYIDPLDGTKNFIKSLPHFAVSIAASINNKAEVACVYDPMLNELFTAQRGAGARLNNTRIRIKEVKELKNMIVATNFLFKNKKYSDSYIKIMTSMLTNFSGIRCTGSAALDLCYLAASRIDAYFELALKPWDIAAGILIAREAGAILTDYAGGIEYLNSGNLVGAGARNIKFIINQTREIAELTKMH
ncbi:inositol-1-monophosphatase [Candidatus Photodesmus katoptron]|uniref:Inositol-1-monophosphatase n=1 Tax=Candidatus Photodesmus katoptron Akat1 TaxID=1236703 RepID=S3DG13_9GAMM|nr:inositol-1-monophosphatase [Candidatus Photodesmus katoptron]EPE37332.1 inositol-1-monophosphatase [Candidatus Photodesmus katoptron Akat1]KEY89997.1 inositol-1-monophosphatase [Candidatus Photodesmus katoptron]